MSIFPEAPCVLLVYFSNFNICMQCYSVALLVFSFSISPLLELFLFLFENVQSFLMLFSHLEYTENESLKFNLHMHYENVFLSIVCLVKM